MPAHLSRAQRSYQRIIGLRFGTIFAGFVALMWTGAFSAFTGGTPRIVLAVALTTVSALCLFLGIYLFVTKRPARKQPLPYFKSGVFWAKFYGVIGVESLAIFWAVRLFQTHGVDNITLPIIVLLVGLHFYPLAYWNGNTTWYTTATVLSITMVLLMVLVPNDATTTILGAPHSSTWAIVSSGVMVLTMIFTSLVSALLYLRTDK